MGLAPEDKRGALISELFVLGGKLGLDGTEIGELVDISPTGATGASS